MSVALPWQWRASPALLNTPGVCCWDTGDAPPCPEPPEWGCVDADPRRGYRLIWGLFCHRHHAELPRVLTADWAVFGGRVDSVMEYVQTHQPKAL